MNKDERLADFLGWFSLGLGTVQLLSPKGLNQAAGIVDDPTSRLVQRLVGVRELGAFAAIQGDRPRPVLPLWGRVGGDCADLVLLAVAWRRKRARAWRLGITIANIAAVTALDAYAATRLADDEGGSAIGSHHPGAATTIKRPREEVAAAWADREKGIGHAAAVSFRDAPGERGTEVRLEFEGISTEKAKDLLRRFKQQLETGEVARSEATPEGADPGRLLKQRPAQPVADGSRS